MSSQREKHCSFCGKDREQTKLLIDGPDGVCICDECISICNSMLEESNDVTSENNEKVALKKPAELKAELDKYIVGQDKAKRVLSVAVYNHYKRINAVANKSKKDDDGVDIEKSNILLLGPRVAVKRCLQVRLLKFSTYRSQLRTQPRSPKQATLARTLKIFF